MPLSCSVCMLCFTPARLRYTHLVICLSCRRHVFVMIFIVAVVKSVSSFEIG